MKNGSLVINGILAIAVVILFVLHFSDNDEVDEHQEVRSSEMVIQPNEGGLDVAYVLIDSLLAYYKMAQDLSEDLLNSKQSLENELTTKGQSLEKKIADFQYQVQKGLITSWDAQEQEKKLTEEQQVFVNLQNDMQGRLMQDEQEKNVQVYEAVIDYVDRYNADKGHNLIISQTSGGVLLYGEKYMNITKTILDGLNEEYDASK